jgi:O-antigen/teichoic acid export membrane protein
MKKWLRRARGVVGMSLAWAIAGALVGGLFEAIDNVLPGALPFISRVDMWPQTLAIPGFLGGAVFAVVLGIAASRRRFDELSLSQFAAWGAVAGLLLGGLGVSLGAPAFLVGITTVWGAVAASGSLVLGRMAERRELLDAGAEVPAVEPAVEARELLGRRD